ncbi:phosphate acetyltransferase [Natranaerobius thermophilus]|uniref:Phosphate acetyltransferase n=1 Tax=Natranaerobius thermophilus (strain ATCC BAA-1301 / DSM 18059 / JW/NM-WN-LF) TaxID=457570 RepID=B2A4L3_NATTJ|nr:phosphate acetyltransferase [Natranaerobius thermophilus]ACB85188.1 phosphotransacetylase [Natranaerobius thermophilus JW/NM-WN-LF]
MSELLTQIKNKASQQKKMIALPEATEPRMVKATQQILQEGFADITLIGDQDEIEKVANNEGVDLSGAEILNPKETDKNDDYAEKLFELRQHKGITMEDAQKIVEDPLYFAALMVKAGDADGYVGGAVNTTGDTFRPALQIIKTAPGISVVSSSFIMLVPDCEYGDNGVFVFSDCALNPNPDKNQMAEIAITTAETAKNLAGIDPKVGMLSFSTKGSADHELAQKVVEATKIAKDKEPDMMIDGELQLDAAIMPSVGEKKAPGSEVAGNANTLIFPDLQSGNIGYKLVQRLAGARAVGPVTQGFAMPVNDLSRGCSVQDIVDIAAITSVQAQG